MNQSKVPVSTIAYRRQKQIEDCLYDNLLQRPYTSVSISNICHQLDISRKSFYNYFPDKDSCFRAIISRKLHQCVQRITIGLPDGAAREAVIAAFLNYWKAERGFLDILVRNKLLFLLNSQCLHFFQNEDRTILSYLDTPQLEPDEFVLSSYINTHITLIMQWYLHGFAESVEEMVIKYKRLVYQPLLHMKQSGNS